MRSRFTSYQRRALGDRTLGWTLITYGFKVDMRVLAKAYHDQKTTSGDALSLPGDNKWLRKQVLLTRSWFRWGRQLYYSNVARDSLPPYAQNALHGYCNGWSAEECDKVTRKYGHWYAPALTEAHFRAKRPMGQLWMACAGTRACKLSRNRRCYELAVPYELSRVCSAVFLAMLRACLAVCAHCPMSDAMSLLFCSRAQL